MWGRGRGRGGRHEKNKIDMEQPRCFGVAPLLCVFSENAESSVSQVYPKTHSSLEL